MNKTSKQSWLPLILVALSTFIIILDSTFMNVSISQLIIDLNTSMGTVRTIITFYTLTTASLMLIGARLQDIIGKKKIFLIGAVIYGIGATIASLSINAPMLFIGWSVLEGIGGALMTPAALSIISGTYDGDKRTFALAINSALAGIAAAMGPLFGGFVTTFLSWRAGFVIELLIIVFILVFYKKIKTFPTSLSKSDFDKGGSLLSIIGLVILILGIISIDSNYSSYSFIFIIVAIGILIGFTYYEKKLKKNNSVPLLDMDMVSEHNLKYGTIVRLITNVAVGGSLYAISVFLQSILKLSAFATGLAVLPLTVGLLLSSILAPKLAIKTSHKKIIITGFIIAIIGTFLLKYNFGLNTNVVDLIPGLGVLGIGLGFVMSLTIDIALNGTDKEKESNASGFISTGQTLGTSIGTAIIGTILIVGAVGGLHDAINIYYPDQISNQEFHENSELYIQKLSHTNLSNHQDDEIAHIADITIHDAMKLVIDVTTIFLVIGLIATLVLNDKKKKNT